MSCFQCTSGPTVTEACHRLAQSKTSKLITSKNSKHSAASKTPLPEVLLQVHGLCTPASLVGTMRIRVHPLYSLNPSEKIYHGRDRVFQNSGTAHQALTTPIPPRAPT